MGRFVERAYISKTNILKTKVRVALALEQSSGAGLGIFVKYWGEEAKFLTIRIN